MKGKLFSFVKDKGASGGRKIIKFDDGESNTETSKEKLCLVKEFKVVFN